MTPTTSNPNFDKEKPEGSRETVDESLRRAKTPKPPQPPRHETADDDDVKPGAGSEPPVGT